MTIDRTPKKRRLNLDAASSFSISLKHCYLKIAGHWYRSERRSGISDIDYPDFQHNLKLQRQNYTSNGIKPMEKATDAQRLILSRSFDRFPSVDVTPEQPPAKIAD